jgi:hypothetical protein
MAAISTGALVMEDICMIVDARTSQIKVHAAGSSRDGGQYFHMRY